MYRARDLITGDIVTMKVMKIFHNDEADGVPAHALREVSLLRYLSHPNIVRYSHTGSDRARSKDLAYCGPGTSFASSMWELRRCLLRQRST